MRRRVLISPVASVNLHRLNLITLPCPRTLSRHLSWEFFLIHQISKLESDQHTNPGPPRVNLPSTRRQHLLPSTGTSHSGYGFAIVPGQVTADPPNEKDRRSSCSVVAWLHYPSDYTTQPYIFYSSLLRLSDPRHPPIHNCPSPWPVLPLVASTATAICRDRRASSWNDRLAYWSAVPYSTIHRGPQPS